MGYLVDTSSFYKQIKVVTGTMHAGPPKNIEETVNDLLDEDWNIVSVFPMLDSHIHSNSRICFVLAKNKETNDG